MLHGLLVVGLVSSCWLPGQEPGNSGITVRNDTSTTITFEMSIANGTIPVPGSVASDATGVILSLAGTDPKNRVDLDERGCTRGDLIARNTSDLEIARHPPGLCAGQTWEIEE